MQIRALPRGCLSLGATIPIALADAVLIPAYAYLDPGTGTMLLQGMVAALAGAGAVIVAKYAQIKEFIRSRVSDGASAASAGGDTSDAQRGLDKR